MTTAVVVQARMASTRLPGKVLKSIGPHTVLEEVLRRCHAIPGADVVVCATSDGRDDDQIEAVAELAGAVVTRGPALDVLRRYRLASEFVEADVVMRITSDCPLLDPTVCGDVLSHLATEDVDYCANNMPISFPHGLDCEAFSRQALRRADETAIEPADREHVTPWLRRDPGVRRAAVKGPGGPVGQQRWTLDYPEDYEFLRAIFALLPPPPAILGWAEVLGLIEAQPDLCAINASHRMERI